MPRTTVPKMYRFPQKTVDQIEELAARHHGLDRTKIVVAAIAEMYARDTRDTRDAIPANPARPVTAKGRDEKTVATAVAVGGKKSRKNSG